MIDDEEKEKYNADLIRMNDQAQKVEESQILEAYAKAKVIQSEQVQQINQKE